MKMNWLKIVINEQLVALKTGVDAHQILINIVTQERNFHLEFEFLA